MDKSWMSKFRGSEEYMHGAKAFVEFAVSKSTNKECIICPCKKCKFNKSLNPELVYTHLTGGTGIMPGYTEWVFHGERMCDLVSQREPIVEGNSSAPVFDESRTMNAMLCDVFGMHKSRADDVGAQPNVVESVQDAVDDETARKYYKLRMESEKPLHDKTKHSKLGAIIHLYNLKCMGGMSNTIFTSLLEFINQLLPTDGETLPKNTYEAKKSLKDLGLGYEKILACRNNCMLFWKDTEHLDFCTKCGLSKWKDDIGDGQSRPSKRRPIKVLRWFPLIPRLQRLFMSQHTAVNMRWHADGRTKDGVLRHPADGKAWKSFDEKHPDFASDPRNVRLGLTSDGFNPFGNMSSIHSTWPVMVIPYNLPPWLYMKQPNFILSLIIPGPSSPGMAIDVYLQPLISELQELWNVGINTFDVSMKKSFVLRSALMWTINDFPAYADLSGYSTKGKKACPICMESTYSKWLKYGRKCCYMGHRRYLPMDHKWRMKKRAFDGTQELDGVPVVPNGEDILRKLDVLFECGENGAHTEKKTKDRERCSWYKC
jgi:hypothetical protein